MHTDCINQYKPGALYHSDNIEFILIITSPYICEGDDPMLNSFKCYIITESKYRSLSVIDEVNGYYLACCDEIA